MKYKVGDRVKVRKDLVCAKKYGPFYVANENMVAMSGEVRQIEKVMLAEEYGGYSHYSVYGGAWKWTDEMFEDESALKVGDRVRINWVSSLYRHDGYSDTGIIESIDGGGAYRFNVGGFSSRLNTILCFREDQLTKIEKACRGCSSWEPVKTTEDGFTYYKDPFLPSGEAWLSMGSTTIGTAKSCMKPRKERSLMTRISATAKKLFDADTKTLIKAGYLDNCLNVTQEGRDAMWPILMDAHKKDLVAAAKEQFAEEKEARDSE